MTKQNYTEVNSKTWDKLAENGCEWSIPISHEEYVKAKAGEWSVYLIKNPVPTWYLKDFHVQ